MSDSSRIDPFSVKHFPKWHPRRLCFTAGARLSEVSSRRRFAKNELPWRSLDDLPKLNCVDWADTEVRPEQLQHLLSAIRLTDGLTGTCCVEVGGYRGVTAAALAAATSRNYVVVDPYIGYGGSDADMAAMRRRTGGLPHVIHERKTSGQAAATWSHGPISFVFINAVHDYVNVKFDLWAWSRHVVPDGLLAFHDTDNEIFAGVRRAIREASPPLTLVAHVPDLVILRKDN